MTQTATAAPVAPAIPGAPTPDGLPIDADLILVELGNAKPTKTTFCDWDGVAPAVTYVYIPTGKDHFPEGHHGYVQAVDPQVNGQAIRRHVEHAAYELGGVTHLPGHEPVLVIVSADGVWKNHSEPATTPEWVWSNNPETQRLVAEFFACPQGRPADVEMTHFTTAGPPGVSPPPDDGIAPGANFEMNALITQNGRDTQARTFGGPGGTSGTSTTAPGATSMTLDDQTAPGSTTAWTNMRVIRGAVWAQIISNTNATPPVLTVDRWYNFATPGGAAGSTPAAGVYGIIGGPAPSWVIGLSTSTTSLPTSAGACTNTVLPGPEITTSGGGLVRQICPWAHTASAATTTLTPIFTANGSDTLPVTIGSIGVFNSMVVSDGTGTMFFNTLLTTPATLSSIGDQLTLTETISGS